MMFLSSVLGLVQCLSIVKPITTSYSTARVNVFHTIENNEWCSIYRPDLCDSISGNKMPDANQWNIEHVLPQSWLKKALSPNEFAIARADINHLFVSDSRTNSYRSNYQFADCEKENSLCKQGYEPVNESKGVVARAMFYAAYQYRIFLSADMVETLKKWNNEYPVSDYEYTRNQRVYEVQQNDNYFINHPELVDSCFE